MPTQYAPVPADDHDEGYAMSTIEAGTAQMVPSPPEDDEVPWSAGMCDCYTVRFLRFNIYWCTPCMLARIHAALTTGVADTMNPWICAGLVVPMVVGSSVAVAVPLATKGQFSVPFAHQVGFCAIAGYTMWQRQQIRQKYKIGGSCCGDCLMSFFCFPCAIGQHYLEMAKRGVNPGSVCCKIAPPGPAAPQQQRQQQPAYAVRKQ